MLDVGEICVGNEGVEYDSGKWIYDEKYLGVPCVLLSHWLVDVVEKGGERRKGSRYQENEEREEQNLS